MSALGNALVALPWTLGDLIVLGVVLLGIALVAVCVQLLVLTLTEPPRRRR